MVVTVVTSGIMSLVLGSVRVDILVVTIVLVVVIVVFA